MILTPEFQNHYNVEPLPMRRKPTNQFDVLIERTIADIVREIGPIPLCQRIALARIIEQCARDWHRLERW